MPKRVECGTYVFFRASQVPSAFPPVAGGVRGEDETIMQGSSLFLRSAQNGSFFGRGITGTMGILMKEL